MADPREAVLSRLVALLGTIVGTSNVARNVLLTDDAQGEFKQVTVLEGDEFASEDDAIARPPIAPRIVHMHPQILLQNVAGADAVGPGLSSLRASILKAIATDSQLIDLTHNSRGGRYIGMESDLAFSRAMVGQMALKFQFTYVLRPDQL